MNVTLDDVESVCYGWIYLTTRVLGYSCYATERLLDAHDAASETSVCEVCKVFVSESLFLQQGDRSFVYSRG